MRYEGAPNVTRHGHRNSPIRETAQISGIMRNNRGPKIFVKMLLETRYPALFRSSDLAVLNYHNPWGSNFEEWREVKLVKGKTLVSEIVIDLDISGLASELCSIVAP